MNRLLRTIANEFSACRAITRFDGSLAWPQGHGDELIHEFMVEVADAQERNDQWLSAVATDLLRIMDQLAELKSELQPEGPLALAASRRQVEALEARIQGLLSGECPV